MPVGLNHLQLLNREPQTAISENAGLKRTVEQQTARIWNLKHAAGVTARHIPTELSAITHALRGCPPSLPQAPCFYMLAKAIDAVSNAQALQRLLQHARIVGAHEARRNA